MMPPPFISSPRMREVEAELSDERKRSARLAAWAVAAVESSGRGVGLLPPPPLGPASGKAAVLAGGGVAGGVAGVASSSAAGGLNTSNDTANILTLTTGGGNGRVSPSFARQGLGPDSAPLSERVEGV